MDWPFLPKYLYVTREGLPVFMHFRHSLWAAISFIMIVTPGNAYDFICLKTVVKTPSSYIGVISSKAKRIKFLNKLKKLDVSADDLRKIHIPAGIDIGAQTPEEIAISISSEIIKINNKFFLGTDKFNEKLSQQNKEGVLNVKDKR